MTDLVQTLLEQKIREQEKEIASLACQSERHAQNYVAMRHLYEQVDDYLTAAGYPRESGLLYSEDLHDVIGRLKKALNVEQAA